MFSNDIFTIVLNSTQVKKSRENINSHDISSNSKLHEGNTIVTKIGKACSMSVLKETSNVTFSIMKDEDNKTYLRNVKGSNVIESQALEKPC